MILMSGIKKTINTLYPPSIPTKKDTRTSLRTLPPSPCADSENAKILVISKQPLFSEDMITYALAMAGKRHAEIVALNLDEQERDFKAFQKRSNTNIATFLHKAKEAGISLSHMVCDGPEERVVDHLYAAIDGLTFVMDDVPAMLGASHAIPVYVHTQ